MASLTVSRKRPRVSEDNRKRASRACDACRRLKEKCEGDFPCTRCTRLERICEFADSVKRAEVAGPHFNERDFFDVERIKAMESLLRHYTGRSTFDKGTLTQLVDSIQDEQISSKKPMSLDDESDTIDRDISNEDQDENYTIQPLSSVTAVYTSELSHNHFSAHFQRKLKEGLEDSQTEHMPSIPHSTELGRAFLLQSEPSVIASAAKFLPPQEVANFLLDIFFVYAQTNYSYVDEQTLRERLDGYFSRPGSISTQDSSWICTALMTFAIGTQFAHLSSLRQDEDEDEDEDGKKVYHSEAEDSIALSPDDSAALTFYHAAKSLMPDAIAIASIESVQAFLLLGVYTLPIDAEGLSYTYFGVALRLAILNGMHRNLTHQIGMNARSAEIRNRIWWTAYTLEKRLCALHGRPVSVSKLDVDAGQPSDYPPLRSEGRIDTMPNILAMIKLTTFLEEARDKLSLMRKTSGRASASGSSLDSILQIKKDLHEYWQSLPSDKYCRDLTPNRHLFRFNIHLALTYHLVHIFIGRTFIFRFSPRSASNTPNSLPKQARLDLSGIREDLLAGCVQSALIVIDLCQTLQDAVGLARASYTEFTTCRAALFVILAQRIHERSARLRKASKKGLTLIKSMSLGIYGASADKSAIESMETALRRLDEGATGQKNAKSGRGKSAGSAYDQFRDWALLWKSDSGDPTNLMASNSSTPLPELPVSLETADFASLEPLQNLGWDMYSPTFPFEFGNFSQTMGYSCINDSSYQ